MQKGNKFRIGVLALIGQPYHHVMSNLISFQINNGMQGIYECIIYRVTPHRESIRQRVREMALEDGCDVVVPIGELCFRSSMQVSSEIGGIPIIFIGVRNPTGPNGIASLEAPGRMVTGILRAVASPEKLARHIAELYPDITSLMIPYLSEPHLTFEANEIKRILSQIGMQVFVAPIEESEISLRETIKTHENKVQAIYLLEGCFSNCLQDEIAYHCWEKCLISIGSWFTAIEAGFSCAFAGDLSKMVLELCTRVRRHCEEGAPLESMPIAVLPDDREFIVNIDMFRRVDFNTTSLKRICLNKNVKAVRKWINVSRKLLKS